MKKVNLIGKILCIGLILALVFNACKKEENDAPVQKAGGAVVVWNGATDRAFAVNIKAVQNKDKTNASGVKITSNSHSETFPGIYFIWDWKQPDNGYLKVSASIFDQYCSFVLTSKEANTFWDFKIELTQLQRATMKTADNCYVFFIPRAQNNKNINMVFLDESSFVEHIPCECCGRCILCDPCPKCDVCGECLECCACEFTIDDINLTNFNWNHSQSNQQGGNPGVNSFIINNTEYKKAPAGNELSSVPTTTLPFNWWVLTNYTELGNKDVRYEIVLSYRGEKYLMVVLVDNWGGNRDDVPASFIKL